jgi:hypothetical protein
MMRWSDERYVRLYTRDTTTWKLLPWESKALLPLLLRKLDRTGIIDLGEDGFDGIAALTDMPLDLVQAAMPELLRRRVFVLADSKLVMPHFIEAQEAVASGKARMELHRARVKARNESLQDVTDRDDSSPTVTPSDSTLQDVTPSRAEPSSAVLDPDQRDPGIGSSDAGATEGSLDGPPESTKVFAFAPRRPRDPAPSMPPAELPPAVPTSTPPALTSAEARTGSLFDRDQMPVAPKATAADRVAAVAARVLAVYNTGRIAKRRRAYKLTDKDCNLVRDRLKEGASEEDLFAAARAIWLDDGLRKDVHREFHHALKDTNIGPLGLLDAAGPTVHRSAKLHERELDTAANDVPRPKPIAI